MKKLFVILMVMMGMAVQAQVLAPKGSIEIKPRLSRYSFCISLNPSANSGAVSYGIHKLTPDSTQEITFITYDTFLRQFSGNEESRANPHKIDFFEKEGITRQTIKDLWKLRYASFPYGKSEEIGWGGEKGVPTEGQMRILSRYGIKFIGDAVYGDNLIKLLKDMENAAWVGEYMRAK